MKKLNVSALLSSMFLGAFALPALAQGETETIRFAWPSAINSGVAPLTFATKLGFFEREGLELDLISLTGSGVIVPQLQAGNIDAAYSGLEPVIISHQPGTPDLGIYFVYNFIPSSIWEMAVLADSDIKTIADLKGKTIGVLSLASSNVLTTKAILKAAGLSESDVQFQAVGVGAAAYEALKGGQIDVLNLFDTTHKRLELSGTELRRLEVSEDLRGSSHGISVAMKTYEERPEFLGKFGRVLAEANLACDANLEACVRSYWEAYPQLAPSSDQEEEKMENEKAVLQSRLANLLNVQGLYGEFPEEGWRNLVRALEDGGMVTDPDVPLNLYYTNALVPMFNDFNKEEIIETAKQVQ